MEYIVVDDGSEDGTLAVARARSDTDPRVRYISFSRNFGKEAAMFAGLRKPPAILFASWTPTCRIRPRCFPLCMRR
jgi:glycosyltransferase involved in cell wall biosynthesis